MFPKHLILKYLRRFKYCVIGPSVADLKKEAGIYDEETGKRNFESINAVLKEEEEGLSGVVEVADIKVKFADGCEFKFQENYLSTGAFHGDMDFFEALGIEVEYSPKKAN